MSSPTADFITIYLTNRAPKLLREEEWPILVSTPESNKAQDLIVRVHKGASSGLLAVVYGQKGAGISEIPGAGDYAGQYIDCTGNQADFMDYIASALFEVGGRLGMSTKQVWILVQQLEAFPL